MKCENKRLNYWCNNKDVKKIQRRTSVTPNKFDGKILMMCAACRQANNGEIKFVK